MLNNDLDRNRELQLTRTALLLVLLTGTAIVAQPTVAAAAEPAVSIYVDPTGSDLTGDGSANSPYRTIEKGIRSVVAPGTHVVIRPGTYQPTGTSCEYGAIDEIDASNPGISGTSANPIVIQAETPGTVLWSQHVILPAEWAQHSGSVWSFEYGAYEEGFPCRAPTQLGEDIDFTPGVAGVHSRNGGAGPDAGLLLFPELSLASVDQPGEWYRDTTAKRIYAWTTDGASPNAHQMSFARGLASLAIDQNSYWTISGIHFHGSALNNIQFSHVNGPSDFVTITDNVFSSAGDHSIGGDSTNGSHIRIDIRRGRGWLISHNTFYGATGEFIHSGDEQVYIDDGTSTTPGDVYEYNVFDGSGQDTYFARADMPTGWSITDTAPGIIIATENGDILRHNEFRHLTDYSLILEWNSRNYQIYGNNIHHGRRGAITISPEGATNTPNGNHDIYNNIMWALDSAGGAIGAIAIEGPTSGSRFYNNTIEVTNPGGGSNGVWIDVRDEPGRQKPANNRFFNNIFIDRTPTSNHIVEMVGGTVGNTFDNNIYFRENNTGSLFVEGNQTYDTLEAWQATGRDLESLITDPEVASISSGDFHLLDTSPARDQGVDFSAIFSDDFDGAARQPGAWDIGAYEFGDGTQAGPRFRDVPVTHLFFTDVEWLADRGITKGCNPPLNNNFCPTDNVTRGQMAAFLVRALDLTDDGGGNSFIDDDGSIFETDIAKLAQAGITKGCNPPLNNNFCPTDNVTRGQMAAFLHRALGAS